MIKSEKRGLSYTCAARLFLSEGLTFGENTLAIVELRVDPAQPEQALVAAIVERRVVALRLPSRSVRALTRGLKTLNLEFEDFPQASQQTKDLLRFVRDGIKGRAFARGHEP